MFKLKKTALVASVAALAALGGPALAGPALGDQVAAASTSSVQLDGRLALTGMRLCQSLPVSSSSMTELSCQALQQTVLSGPYPSLWETSQVLSATLAAAPTAPISARQQYAAEVYATLDQYANGRRFSAGLTSVAGKSTATRFYDDNAWVGLDLVHAYEQSDQPVLLDAARDIFSFERTGEWRASDPPDQQHYPGGIYWNTLRLTRVGHATAGAARFALELYRLTHNRIYLKFGEREYEWVRQTLGTSAGLYHNRVSPGGAITGMGNENGEALMIDDGVLLYQITGAKRFLQQATQTAKANLSRYTLSKLETSCPAFNAILLRSFAALNSVSPLRTFTKRLTKYAAWAAQQSDPQTGAFPLTGFGISCNQPLPQAGVTGTLILHTAG